MNNSNVYGGDLVEFIESTGCNKRMQVGDHAVLWSVFTGDFFVVPTYENECLDETTVKYITWQMGTTEQAFNDMLDEFKSQNNGTD